MKQILKRFANTLTVLVSIGLVIALFTNNADEIRQNGALWICGFFYALVLAFNYIILGTFTLWHKNAEM
jgi:hypothetical protein